MSIEIHEIRSLADMQPIAAEIGKQAGRDFSFKVRLRGRTYKVTVEHVRRAGMPMLGDIRPAALYKHEFPGQG